MAKKKVLIIEDYADTAKMMSQIMERGGFKPMVAADGLSGIEKAKKEKPDLILLDIMMSEMGGVEACRKLKDDPETADIPVIYVTVRQMEDNMKVGDNASAEAYVRKPFNPDYLVEVVNVILEKHSK